MGELHCSVLMDKQVHKFDSVGGGRGGQRTVREAGAGPFRFRFCLDSTVLRSSPGSSA